MEQVVDVAIIGGGINGCGCAAEAALRGLSVVLLEQDDIASKTSSSSTKLIHGGLRYLEHYEFGLVKKAIEERSILLRRSPQLVRPQTLMLPYQKHMRPAWMLRLGLLFYDHLARSNNLPKAQAVSRDKSIYFEPLQDQLNKGFLFYDATADDARLTLANALLAKNLGAHIKTRTKVLDIQAQDKIWHLTARSKKGLNTIKSRALINAAGPWVKSINQLTKSPMQQDVSLVQGSHIVLPALYERTHAYFLQNEDERIIFVIPYHGFSMIGTTDVLFQGSLERIHISEEEISYLLNSVNSYFKTNAQPKDIITTWSGVRTLLASSNVSCQKLSRDFAFEYVNETAPQITLTCGKMTTYRQLAEQAIDALKEIFPNISASSSHKTLLPGAEVDGMSFEQYIGYARKKYTWLDASILNRYLATYGCNTEHVLAQCTHMNTLGQSFGGSLFQAEVDYLINNEWAQTSEDILQRRTKLGLRHQAVNLTLLEKYLTHW